LKNRRIRQFIEIGQGKHTKQATFGTLKQRQIRKMMKTAIVIPCYNEANRLPIEQFRSFLTTYPQYTLCFVNDGSTDNTMAVLRSLQAGGEDRVTVIDCPANGGKAEAVRQGMLYLSEQGMSEFIGFLDADLSTDFTDFARLETALAQNPALQLVSGARLKRTGAAITRNLKRHLLGRGIAGLIRLLLDMPLQDTQCGAKLFRREIIPYLFSQPFQSRWLFDVEIFFRLKRLYGAAQAMQRIEELPLLRWTHVGDSKLSASESVRIPVQIGKIALAYRFQRREDYKPELTWAV
jgi:dolichyl-phosphate beta-glucosyltransferase